MTIVFLVLFGLILCFGFVLLYGAPYLPTLTPQVEEALNMIDLKPGQTLLELGCGDGKVLLAAAVRGWNVVGYELNPVLATIAWTRTRRYHKNGQVRVICGNFWKATWPPADGIFVFLLDKYMLKLDNKIMQDTKKNVKLVSFVFRLPSKQPIAKSKGLYLYEYSQQYNR